MSDKQEEKAQNTEAISLLTKNMTDVANMDSVSLPSTETPPPPEMSTTESSTTSQMWTFVVYYGSKVLAGAYS
jgi:hypothetical protein